MKFIKLTAAYSKLPVYVNMEHVIYMIRCKDEEEYTVIRYGTGTERDDGRYQVKETPEEILELCCNIELQLCGQVATPASHFTT